MDKTVNVVIFASGGGSNAEAIVKYFAQDTHIKISFLISNNPHSGVFKIGINYGIKTELINRENFKNEFYFVELLKSNKIDYIILAGFLWLIPEFLIREFPNRIINIHPSLLPKYGGKGMYGMHVHQSVFDHNEKESGMTVHLVNEQYDQGLILFQAECNVEEAKNPKEIAQCVLALEHKHYPSVIKNYIESHQLSLNK